MRNPAMIVLAVLAVALAGCSITDESDSIDIVATTTILGDVARNIAGDDADVTVLLPIGADPHDYQPSARQVALIQEADLVIANGLDLEEGLEDVLAAAEADGVTLLEVGPLVDPLPFTAGTDDHNDEGHDDEADHEEGEDHDDHGHGDDDPHVWMDPARMAEASRLLAQELQTVAPGPDWSGRAEAYADQLMAADEEIAQLLATIPANRRQLVTNHDALGYFAARYDFEVVGVVIPGGATLAEPSSAELAALVEEIQEKNVAAIFAETTEPSALAEAVAAEVGDDVTVVELFTGSLGSPGSGAETLIDLLRTNAQRIATALS